MIELVLFVAYFTWANLFAGGRAGWKQVGRQHGGPLRGRGIYYSGLIAIIALGSAYGWLGALAGLSFLVWRLPGWYGAIDAGMDADDPKRDHWVLKNRRLRDFVVMTVRGLAAFPFFAVLTWLHPSWVPAMTLLIVCVLQGAIYDLVHRHLDRKNGIAEALAGAVWGVAFFTMLEGL